jgi:cardiolipin synthase A/B
VDQLIIGPELRRQIILETFAGARSSVTLSLFRCDDSRVLDQLVATARRGLQVKVLVTQRARGWGKRLGSLVTLLRHTGIQVKQYDGPWAKYHAKYIVVDEALAVIGSLNLTRKCFTDTLDFLVLSRDPELAASLKRLFDIDWSYPFVALPELHNALIVGPDDSRELMLKLLRRARSRIKIIDHRVSHPEVLLLLAQKMREGVNVRIIGRGEAGHFISHGKLVLIDDETAVIGSASLSRPGLDIRREVSLMLTEASAVDELRRFFDQLIREGPDDRTSTIEEIDEDDEDDS